MRGTPLGSPPGLSDEVERTDHVVSTDPEVIVRVHRRKGLEGALPCVYSIHGGGYILGSYAMDDCPLRQLVPAVRRRRCVGRVPARTRDAVPGTARRLRRRAAVGRRPCGRARRRPRPHRHRRRECRRRSRRRARAARHATAARPQLRFQLLDCPMIDDRQATVSSRLERLLVWSRHSNEFGWRSYLGELYGADDIPYVAAAARCADLRGLPPTFVAVGGADGFRDEDVDYALPALAGGRRDRAPRLPGCTARRADVPGQPDRAAVAARRGRVARPAARRAGGRGVADSTTRGLAPPSRRVLLLLPGPGRSG